MTNKELKKVWIIIKWILAFANVFALGYLVGWFIGYEYAFDAVWKACELIVELG